MQQLDVFISVKPKKGQMQSVIIKSIEQNLHCVYQARNKLLECSYQPAQAATPSDTIAIATSVDEPPMFQEKKGRHFFQETVYVNTLEVGCKVHVHLYF